MGARRPTHAMVLAAGFGQRMRPLTDSVPKPLIRLGGRALIDHVLDRLGDAGIREAVVNVHYLAGLVEAHLRKRARPRIAISDERDGLLDTGGGVHKALPLLGDGSFFVHNSDSVWIERNGNTVARMMDAWNPAAMDALLLLAPAAASLGYNGRGDFHMSEAGALSWRNGEERAPYVFAGVSINHPRLFDGAPAGAFSLVRLWRQALAAGRLAAIRLDGVWMHVGTPQALSDAERRLSGRAA